ncbi:unnamed protein product, partial [Amoebophrya sp. A25]|eukprot:GSA25T00001553001.1
MPSLTKGRGHHSVMLRDFASEDPDETATSLLMHKRGSLLSDSDDERQPMQGPGHYDRKSSSAMPFDGDLMNRSLPLWAMSHLIRKLTRIFGARGGEGAFVLLLLSSACVLTGVITALGAIFHVEPVHRSHGNLRGSSRSYNTFLQTLEGDKGEQGTVEVVESDVGEDTNGLGEESAKHSDGVGGLPTAFEGDWPRGLERRSP